jgi:anaerobic magnesium-protoporphyrin IX monomethyl ester cyclase
MNLLFVVPRFADPGQFYQYPIGLASVYAFIKRNGVSVSCLNLCHERGTTQELLEREFANRPVDIVCTGGMSTGWLLIKDILESAKRISGDIITVVGGPIVTADPNLALEQLPIDYGVIGEGEYTLQELLEILKKSEQPDSVRGLAFRNSEGRVVVTEKRGEIKDLNTLPIPELDDFGFRETLGNFKYAQQLPIVESFDEVRFAEIIGSRSCPFSCTFCYHPLGNKYRQRSLDHLFSEIDYLHHNFGVNLIGFSDDLFSTDQKRLLALAERIKPYKIKWYACFRVNDVRSEVMEQLAASGLIFAAFGIESMNDEVLKSMKKLTTSANIVKALDICHQAGVGCGGNIILGDIADTAETVNESITWWKNNPARNVSLGFIKAIPDAEIYRYALVKGIIRNKLAHARNLPLLNLSKLTNKQYYDLVVKVCWWNLTRTYKTPGTLIASKKIDDFYGDKQFYELKLCCPFCGKEQTQKKFMASPVLNMIITCVHCFSGFKISQKQAFPGVFSSTKMIVYVLGKLFESYAMRFSFFRSYNHILRRIFNRFKLRLN